MNILDNLEAYLAYSSTEGALPEYNEGTPAVLRYVDILVSTSEWCGQLYRLIIRYRREELEIILTRLGHLCLGWKQMVLLAMMTLLFWLCLATGRCI